MEWRNHGRLEWNDRMMPNRLLKLRVFRCFSIPILYSTIPIFHSSIFPVLEHSNLPGVSDFAIRISDFPRLIPRKGTKIVKKANEPWN
jgi:hypothetical protein